MTHPITTPPPVDAVVTLALNDVLAERARAIGAFGHTAQADDAMGLSALGEKAAAFARIAADRVAGPPQRRELAAARKKAVQAASILFALIDAIDREMARSTPSDGGVGA